MKPPSCQFCRWNRNRRRRRAESPIGDLFVSAGEASIIQRLISPTPPIVGRVRCLIAATTLHSTRGSAEFTHGIIRNIQTNPEIDAAPCGSRGADLPPLPPQGDFKVRAQPVRVRFE